MQINELKMGSQARILTLKKTAQAYRNKLITIGLIPGAIFTLLRVAPLGDPIQIEVRGFQLTLRKAEAALFEVESIS